jgi:hypothetical protein
MELNSAHDIVMYIVRIILMILGIWKLVELLRKIKD